MRTLTLVVTLAFSLAGFVAPGGATAGSDPDVITAFEQTAAYIAALPDAQLDHGRRTSLVQKLRAGEAAFVRGQQCAAAGVLGAYLAETQALRRRMPVAEDLFNRGWHILTLFPPGRCALENVGMQPRITIDGSDETHFAATIEFGAPALTTLRDGGEVWTRVDVPGTDSTIASEDGTPGLPVLRRLIAFPRGASVSIRSTATFAAPLKLNLYPYQPSDDAASPPPPIDSYFGSEPPPDSLFPFTPFLKDARAYAVDALSPSDPCSIQTIGRARFLDLAQISCAAGRYNPISDRFDSVRSVQLDVSFSGGEGVFANTELMSPFESASEVYLESVLNAAAVTNHLSAAVGARRCVGEELLILTAPNLHAAADTLADWKTAKGITTRVVDVTDTDKFHIQQRIRDEVEHCAVAPSYVLLLGDAELIPTFYVQRQGYDPGVVIASDYPYAALGYFENDLLPDLAVARIPVDTLDEALAVVDKIVSYESSPPFSFGGFYNDAAIASEFQCCATGVADGTEGNPFIRPAEAIRDELVSDGKNVDRIYAEDKTANDAYTGDTTPANYFDQTPLPTELKPPFAWNGTASDVVAAVNDGRFLLVHIDHGWSGGWGLPAFTTSKIPSLTNGPLLPLVLSINCSSGYFDNETDGTGNSGVYFAESMIRKADGGAVGVIAGTRMTNTGWNAYLAQGFVDALFPDMLPTYGSIDAEHRLGDILNHGKLAAIAAYGTAGNGQNHLVLYNAFGDPTQETWTASPFHLPHDYFATHNPFEVEVNYAVDGATITALQLTRDGVLPIGRAVVHDGVAHVTFFIEPLNDVPIQLSASKPNAVNALLTASRDSG
jgi:hypothetical protein